MIDLTRCPRCSAELEIDPVRGRPSAARGYDDCQRRCRVCRIGLSNSSTKPTFIREDWRTGLWRPGETQRLETILRHSLNRKSRKSKKARLANERSEDLLTWNVFSWLEDHGRLGAFARFVGTSADTTDPRVFYWGANDRYPFGRLDLPALLTAPPFLEKPVRLSEPDVILLSGLDLILVEVKLDSPNDRTPGLEKIGEYVAAAAGWFRPAADVVAAGFYELTRNWAIGGAIADRLGRRFTLVNLIRHARRAPEERTRSEFQRIVTTRGTFRQVTWEDCAEAVCPEIIPRLRSQTLYFKPAFPRWRPRDDE
jgi:hypothetical protein